VVQQRYGVPPSQLRLFVHYQPSYYHFHVHVAHIRHEAAGCLAGKAVLLDEVIGEPLLLLFPPPAHTAALLTPQHCLHPQQQCLSLSSASA
jgi:m7GpppX diphosphatase